MRIAFITPEYPTEYANGGGLGSYLERICRVLLEQGHQPEVFVSSTVTETIQHQGVVVHRVDCQRRIEQATRIARAVVRWLPAGSDAIQSSSKLLSRAYCLATAFHQRERHERFDFVQSSDFLAAGLFVKRSPRRPHIIRCSCAADLWAEADGMAGFSRWQCYWERKAIARADRAYAPSQLVAGHYQNVHNLQVGVVRPPLGLNHQDGNECSSDIGLPTRFHIHFGQLRARKGTEFLAKTLPRVWEQQPDYTMVWAGVGSPSFLEALRSSWGKFSDRVQIVGPVDRVTLFSILRRAEVAVLPSRVDNLPNTVIESLQFAKPVIGTLGSSVDELVVNHQNGRLVKFGDFESLSVAIRESWLRPTQNLSADRLVTPTWTEMDPSVAVERLISFAFSGKHGSIRM